MNKEQQMVKDFHKKFGQRILDSPLVFPPKKKAMTIDLYEEQKISHLRIRLIREEFEELIAALEDKDIIEVADALGDLLYVVYGTAVSYGIDMEPIFEEIHKSNMSKADPVVKVRGDGKILKGSGYFLPNLKPILEKMEK